MKKRKADPVILPAPAQSPAERFGLALGAVMSSHRFWSHDHLGGLVRGLDAPDRQARSDLGQLVAAKDRKSLLEIVQRYLDGPLVKDLARVAAQLAAMPAEKVGGWYSSSSFDVSAGFFVTEQRGALAALGDPTAYDIGRAALYIGLGYRAGWISRAESYALLGRGARAAQRLYGSWEAYARGYLAGRWVVAASWNDEMKSMDAICQKLLAEERGPWRTVPWDTDVAHLGEGVTIGGSWSPGPQREAGPLVSIAVRAFADCAGCLRTLPIPAAAPAVRCPACGVETPVGDMWARLPSLALGDEDDEDEDEGPRRPPEGVQLATNSGDTIERIAFEIRGPACDTCGRAVADQDLRAAEGAVTCACGASIALRRATAEHRADDPRFHCLVGERAIQGGAVAGDAPHTFFAIVGGGR